jgi:A/G-specific adenine glycosylase
MPASLIRPNGRIIPLDSVAFSAATVNNVRWCRRQLLKWYARCGRDLPWRRSNVGLYEKILVEVLLQRTQAGTVERFFSGFFERYRNWSDVSAASIPELGQRLRPIGLWRRRATALKALATEMVRRGGSFPVARGEIEALPAVGQYVASAVLLFAHGRPEPLLDSNMARVLERVFEPRRLADIRYDPWLQTLARAVVRSGRSAEVSWAILDIAALYCRPARPACTDCPLLYKCNYARSNVHDEPVRRQPGAPRRRLSGTGPRTPRLAGGA